MRPHECLRGSLAVHKGSENPASTTLPAEVWLADGSFRTPTSTASAVLAATATSASAASAASASAHILSPTTTNSPELWDALPHESLSSPSEEGSVAVMGRSISDAMVADALLSIEQFCPSVCLQFRPPPVTAMVLSIEQVRVWSGAPLPIEQDDAVA
eukprot:scaffold13788_cov29-Tisochrysis_lutea.AAC.3